MAALLATLLLGSTAAAQVEAPRGADAASAVALAQGPSIVGTWVLSSPGPSTRLLQTYHADGTMHSVHDEHPQRTSQLGSWVQEGNQFLMRNISLRFGPDGRQDGSIEVRGIYTLDPGGNTMTGRGDRLELDLNGALLVPPIPWESRATRVVPVPVGAPPGS